MIAIVGLGNIGLPLAIMLNKNYRIVGVDTNKDRLTKIYSRKVTIDEGLKNHYIPFTLSNELTKDIIESSDYILIALPTNKGAHFDTTILCETLDKIYLVKPNAKVIIKSTISFDIVDKYPNVCVCPEFLREQHIYEDLVNADRFVIGECSFTDEVIPMLNFSKAETIRVSNKEAIAIKLFSNTYLAMRLAFFNELDTYCMENKLNTNNVINGVCMDKRIGNYYNKPSICYGGHCLPKDSEALGKALSTYALIPSIIKSNKKRITYINKKLPKGNICVYNDIGSVYLGKPSKSVRLYKTEEDLIWADKIIANNIDSILEKYRDKVITRDDI